MWFCSMPRLCKRFVVRNSSHRRAIHRIALGVVAALALAALPGAAGAAPILDPAGDFLPTYTGPQDPGLDYNLWPRNGVGLNVQVSDLGPDDGNSPVQVVPEPASLALCAVGVIGLLGYGRKRRAHPDADRSMTRKVGGS